MIEVKVPDIGDFADVPVIEVLVEPGQEVKPEDPLVTLESDKATMEIPAPSGGVVKELLVKIGDKVSEGTLIARLDGAGDGSAPAAKPATEEPAKAPAPPAPDSDAGGGHDVQVLVLGSGPGGYAAAFRAADLGLSVAMVEKHEVLGGVCLNVGCIPSKALLHVAKVIAEAEALGEHGVSFGKPSIELDPLRAWKEEVVGKLVKGVTGMAKSRKVRVLHGEAKFTGPHSIDVGGETVTFDNAIVAAGSRAVKLPGVPRDDPRVMDSTDALDLEDIPERLLVIGGGIIGLEMATVYDALGSRVTVVELLDQLIPGCDKDLVRPLQRRIEKRYEAIHLKTKVESVEAKEDGLHVTFSGDVEDAVFDRVLVAVGRVPNGSGLGLDAAGVNVDDRGYVTVDDQLRTNVPHVFAIGDVARPPLLAHKATAEGHVAAEVIAGHDVAYDVRAMPSVAYTEPEVGWVGLTENDAKANGTKFEKAVVPWGASGRALAMDAAAGSTKLLFDPETNRVLGGGVVGTNAGELLAEIGLAIEMGADVEDVGLTVHAHPTLSETVMLAAEIGAGTVTDLPNPKARKKS